MLFCTQDGITQCVLGPMASIKLTSKIVLQAKNSGSEEAALANGSKPPPNKQLRCGGITKNVDTPHAK